jgi:very-short-patch-repair endonuclease
VDGSHHLYEERKQRDAAQSECMEDIGYTVIRFGLLTDWEQILAKYPNIFGVPLK